MVERLSFRSGDHWWKKVYVLAARLQPIIMVGAAGLTIATCAGVRWALSPWALDSKISAQSFRIDTIRALVDTAKQDRQALAEKLDDLIVVECAKLSPEQLDLLRRKFACDTGSRP